MKNQRQWQGKTQGGSLGQKGLLLFFRIWNVYFGYALLSIVVIFYMIFSRKGFLSIWNYFREIHHYDRFKSLRMTYLNHFVFGQTLLDKFALFAGKKKFFKVSVSGQEIFETLLNSPKGIIIASSHIGNFEVAGYMLKQDKKRINGIIYGGESPVIQGYREKILAKNNVTQIPIAQDMSHIFQINKVLNQGEIVSMPCDRVFTGNKTLTVDFLGKKACLPTGAFHLAAKFEVPVITLFAMKVSPRHYHIYIDRIDSGIPEQISSIEKVGALTHNYVKSMEEILGKYPEQWFNFFNFWNS